jgi:hypothetical protein
MGNELSVNFRSQPAEGSAQPLQLLGRLSRHTYRCSSRGQKICLRPDRGEARKSSRISPWRHSLLDLPISVREHLYTHLLLFGEEIQITPSQITRVPGLILLQTCQQLHDEGSAFFYASNTFHCHVAKIVPAQKASAGQLQFPAIRARLDCHMLRDPLNISGGIFFPAPRYHEYLTHVVICLDLTIAHFDTTSSDTSTPTFAKPELETGMTSADMVYMHHTAQYERFRVLRRIKSLWREEHVAWRGKLVIPERTS